MENNMPQEAFEEFDDLEGVKIDEDTRPFLEPGNMLSYPDFKYYYTAMVVMPEIRAREEEFKKFLDFLQKKYTKFLLVGDKRSKLKSEKLFSRIRRVVHYYKSSE